MEGGVIVMDMQEIVSYYSECESLRKVSKKYGISYKSVVKILVSNGVYPEGRASDIRNLMLSGLTVDEIAAKLKISRKAVVSYLSYSKGSYLTDDKTINALRIRAHRARKTKK